MNEIVKYPMKYVTLLKAALLFLAIAAVLSFAGADNVQAAEYYYYNGHQYQITDDCMKWSEAKKACEEKGGHLVTITSAAEQEFLNGILANGSKNLYWIGLYKSGSKKWVTGETFSYQNIEMEQNGQNVFGMYSKDGTGTIRLGLWYDHDDKLRNDYWDYTNTGYICEWDRIPVSSVKLNKKTATVYLKGDNLQLKAYVSPVEATNQRVIWSSSNKRVATVSSKGLVKAVGKGTAVITCRAADGSGKKATCKITVKQPVKVKSVKLNRKSVILYRGKKLQLKATVTPSNATNKSVKWSSSNKRVATVSSKGVVKAAGKGTAVITCKAADGSGKKVTCKIRVKK